MSHLLFMRMVVPLHTAVRTQTVHLKCLHFIGCKLDTRECIFLIFKSFWEIGLLGKYKWNICMHAHTAESESRSDVPDCLQPHGLYSPWNSPGRILKWIAIRFSRGSSQIRGRTQARSLRADSSPAEPPGKNRRNVPQIPPLRFPRLPRCVHCISVKCYWR